MIQDQFYPIFNFFIILWLLSLFVMQEPGSQQGNICEGKGYFFPIDMWLKSLNYLPGLHIGLLSRIILFFISHDNLLGLFFLWVFIFYYYFFI